MIANVSNRGMNSIPFENALSFVAAVVSERVNAYLHSIGLTSACQTAIRTLDRLTFKAARTLKACMSQEYKFQPLFCIDNVDFQEKIHLKRLENPSGMFHGTWGYLHFLAK